MARLTDLERAIVSTSLPPPPDPAALAAAATTAGLLDVAYAVTDAPWGPLVVAATPSGLVRVGFDLAATLDELAERLSPRVLEAPARLDAVRRQLDEYFAGGRHAFDLPLDWTLAGSAFRLRVLRAAAGIPYGERRTYRDVAAAAGNPAAVRAAGSALGANPLCVVVPCHRVLRSAGGLGGYAGGLVAKQALLRLESGLPAEPEPDFSPDVPTP